MLSTVCFKYEEHWHMVVGTSGYETMALSFFRNGNKNHKKCSSLHMAIPTWYIYQPDITWVTWHSVFVHLLFDFGLVSPTFTQFILLLVGVDNMTLRTVCPLSILHRLIIENARTTNAY